MDFILGNHIISLSSLPLKYHPFNEAKIGYALLHTYYMFSLGNCSNYLYFCNNLTYTGL